MITIRKAEDRGRTSLAWLDGRHSFSFGAYNDVDAMGFGPMRVINDDRVAPGGGFPTHPHADMEIVTYVIEGALEHKDSTGSGGVIRPGDLQHMSAGSGIFHSEFNHSQTEPVHLLQIWLFPEEQGLTLSHDQRTFGDERRHTLRLVASRDGRESSLTIQQDANIYASILDEGERVSHELAPGRVGWFQVARGAVTLNGIDLREGDGAAITDETALDIQARHESEFLLFDMTP